MFYLQGEVRIAKKDYESDSAKRFGPMDRWHHVDCFVKDREELEYFDSGAKLQGFKTLSAEDQAELQKKLSKMDGSDLFLYLISDLFTCTFNMCLH